MSTKEDDFKQRFVAIMRDLNTDGRKDPEAMWWMGSLAARLVDKAGKKSWRATKAGLTATDHAGALADLQNTGNRLFAEGQRKKAYAVQAVAVSLVAYRQRDAEVLAGNELLDALIEDNIRFYRQNRHLETELN